MDAIRQPTAGCPALALRRRHPIRATALLAALLLFAVQPPAVSGPATATRLALGVVVPCLS